jgi:hypothetical protein
MIGQNTIHGLLVEPDQRDKTVRPDPEVGHCIWLCAAVFKNNVRSGASPAICDVFESKVAVTRGDMQPALERHGLPQHPSGRHVEEYAVHADGREPDSLILKEGLSGCVMDASAAGQTGISGGQFCNSYVWFLTNNSSSIGYYALYVARSTN